MLASEMIKELKDKMEKYGDLQVLESSRARVSSGDPVEFPAGAVYREIDNSGLEYLGIPSATSQLIFCEDYSLHDLKASRLIAILQEQQELYGDLDVVISWKDRDEIEEILSDESEYIDDEMLDLVPISVVDYSPEKPNEWSEPGFFDIHL